MKLQSILIAVLCLIIQTNCQTCPQTTIEAIISCTFTFNSSCNFNSCRANRITKQITYYLWTECFDYCCPGFPYPYSSTYDSLQPCIRKFSSRPQAVIWIGVSIGVILFLIFIIVPCCKDSFCPLYRLRESIKQCLCSDKKQQKSQKRNLYDNRDQIIQAQAQLSQTKMVPNQLGQKRNKQKNKIIFTNQRVDDILRDDSCEICHLPKSKLYLSCGHKFHPNCMRIQHKVLEKCVTCDTGNIMPIQVYCFKCLERYQLVSQANLKAKYYCQKCQ